MHTHTQSRSIACRLACVRACRARVFSSHHQSAHALTLNKMFNSVCFYVAGVGFMRLHQQRPNGIVSERANRRPNPPCDVVPDCVCVWNTRGRAYRSREFRSFPCGSTIGRRRKASQPAAMNLLRRGVTMDSYTHWFKQLAHRLSCRIV